MKNKKIFYLVFIYLFNVNLSLNSQRHEVDLSYQDKDDEENEVEKFLKKEEPQIKREEKKALLEYCYNGNKFRLALKNKTEGFYGRSLQLFSDSELDQVLFSQSTWDLKFSAYLGRSLKSEIGFRNRARWGNFNSTNHVTDNTVKLVDAVTGNHKHALGKLLFWMREGWIEVLLNDAFNIDACNEHYFKLGAFPFKLGRGISLGDAYAVAPGLLGFYSNNVIDQFAFGTLLHGGIIKDQLHYDIYAEVVENQSDSFDNVVAKIYSQEIGRKLNPSRGFGSINFIIASRLVWILHPFGGDDTMVIEPYILYNRDPELKVDFPHDASSNLVTPGLSVEFESNNVEFGFEFAYNFGAQHVKAWDRNHVLLDRDKKTGNAIFDYSQVVDTNGNRAVESNANKKIVDESVQDPALNGKEIDNSGLFNKITRFRKSFKNKYAGFMFVTDAAYWFNDNVKMAATYGFASGDEDPNQDIDNPNDSDEDDKYEGFIPLQEIYSGKRVLSVFVLGANRIPRPLSFPTNDVPEEDRFASNVSGFTNLVFVGIGWEIFSKSCSCGNPKEFNFRPNIIAYWQETPTRKFDIKTKMTSKDLASKYLGFEVNLFVDVKLLDNLKGYFVSGVFIPGQHFKDIRGKPLNAEQRNALDNLDTTGFKGDKLPVLGTNPAWSVNWGLEYYF